MHGAIRWIVVGAAVLVAGWFVFDGAHALITGDFVTPSSGAYAGAYGPWARVVERVGVDPSSRLMQVVFLSYGLAWLVMTGLFVLRRRYSRVGMLAMAIGAIWYLPFGTILCLLQIVLLLVPAPRATTPG